MSVITKNNNIKNIEEIKDNLYNINDYTSVKKNSKSIITKNQIKIKALKILREIDKKKENTINSFSINH